MPRCDRAGQDSTRLQDSTGWSQGERVQLSPQVFIQQILREAYPEVTSDDPVSYFSETGDAAEALKYSWLYWPNTVLIQGAVFLTLNGDDNKEIVDRLAIPTAEGHPDWPAMPWARMVDSYNVFEIQHLFRRSRGPSEFSEEGHRELGRILVQTWQARLVAVYPERRFAVRMIEADDAMDLRIAVSQESPRLASPEGWDENRRGIIGGL